MPYTLTWNDDGTYVKFFGKVSFSEVREADNLHYGDKNLTISNIKYSILRTLMSRITRQDAQIQAAHDKAASHYKKNLKGRKHWQRRTYRGCF